MWRERGVEYYFGVEVDAPMRSSKVTGSGSFRIRNAGRSKHSVTLPFLLSVEKLSRDTIRLPEVAPIKRPT